ncbi:MAG: hypothetical protein HYY76_00725 [Acidobacteria bacterium]|nr:hypothetical protein [Acidobacteriota bacterium]
MPRCLGVLWGPVVLGALSSACVWPSPERQFLIDFFQACRVYDTTVLARLATVPCNPRADGIVQSFDIVRVERATEGAEAARRVTIRARVRSWEGALSERTMTLGLERRDGQWMVTSLTPPPASQTSPAASSAPPR